jgi:hypothetical protein
MTQAGYSLKMSKKRYTKEDRLREARAFLEKMVRKEKGVLTRITQVVRDK